MTTAEETRRLQLPPNRRYTINNNMITETSKRTAAAKYRSGGLPPLREGGAAYELRGIRDNNK